MVLAYGILNKPVFCRTLIERETHEATPKEIEFVSQSKFLYFKHLPYQGTHWDWLISIPMSKDLYDKYIELGIVHSTDELVNQQNETLRFLVEGKYQDNKKIIECFSPTGKMQALKAIIEHINPGDKIVVFDNFTHTLDFIEKQEWMRKYHPVVHHGRRSKNENVRSYNRFMNDDDARVFLTTRSQCAEGINLQIANHVIIMNCWWTAKDLIQMIGRIKRQDQKKPVYSYLLGYNCYSWINKTTCTKDDVLLPEELDQYNTVAKKIEVNRIWDMDVSEQLPEPMPFEDPTTFEQDFSGWLQNMILPEAECLDSGDAEEARVIKEKTEQWTSIQKALWFMVFSQQNTASLGSPKTASEIPSGASEEEFEDFSRQPGYFMPLKGLFKDADIDLN